MTDENQALPVEALSNESVALQRGEPSESLDLYANFGAQWEAIENFGRAIALSGMCGCEKPEQGTIIAFTCMAEKITPIEFGRIYDLILGKPTMKAATMLAKLRTDYGGDFEWTEVGDDGQRATLKLWYRNKELAPVSYTWEEASKVVVNGKPLIQKDNWVNNPGAMLRARCVTKALRMHVPEIAAGIYDPDELSDATSAVRNMMSQPVTKEEPSRDWLSDLKDKLENCSDSIRENATARILKRFKVAELDSLGPAQAKKVVEAWDAFMDDLAKGEKK